MVIDGHRIAGHEQDAPAATEKGGPGSVGQPGELSARLAAAAKMLADAASVEPVAVTIGRALLFLTKAERAAILLRSPNGLVTCPWSHNLSDVYLRDIVTPKDANPWMHILRHPELSCMDLPTKRETGPTPWFLPDALALSSDHAALVDRITREGIRSICAWPFAKAGRVTGALVYYYDSPRVYTQDEQMVMRAFGSQAAAALRDLGAQLSQMQITMSPRDTTRTPTDSRAAFWPKRAGSAPKQQIIDAASPPLADTRGVAGVEQVRGEIEAQQARPTARTSDYDARETRGSQERAPFATERAQISETPEAKTVRLARDREEREAGRLQLADVQARSETAEVALGGDKGAPAVEEAGTGAARQELEMIQAPAARTGAHEAGRLHEYTWNAVAKVGPEPQERSNAAGRSRWRQATLVAGTVIAAVAIAVLGLGPEHHGPAVRTMEHKPAVQVSAPPVQKRPVPVPHQAIAAGVAPSVAKAGTPPAAFRALRPRKAAYVVVVGTFASANTAEEVKRLVQSNGYVVHVVLQGRVSKVMTAPMRTRAQAEGLARALEAVGLHPRVTAWQEQ